MKEEQSESKDDTPCRFFYHWVRKNFHQKSYGYSLKDALTVIYKTLGKDSGQNICNIIYDDADDDTAKYRRKLYEHYHDCTAVQKYLEQIKSHAGGAEKDSQWTYYKAELTNACDTVGDYCGEKGEGTTSKDPYCGEYHKNKYKCFCKEIEKLSNNPSGHPSKGSSQLSQLKLTCPTLTELELESEAETEAEAEPCPKLETDPVRGIVEVRQSHLGAQAVVVEIPEPHVATTLSMDGGPEPSVQAVSLPDSRQGDEHEHTKPDLSVTQKLPSFSHGNGEDHTLRHGSSVVEASSISTPNTENNNSTITTAIPSVLSTIGIGLPTVVFLLYKVSK
ncbi:KIR protein [Plasmodium coatneyi]|uniref:KIR protein n=1 Tax=Plasmodium coatneyi TaxID=208452 RepID=A0A1B1E477_9APIC|nr:KIR protein [Plasmodium coatneyi]ANQ09777.1 KIR protein [Plasmodium coatneyi]